VRALRANEGYSVPRLLGHLVKLHNCELSMVHDDEERGGGGGGGGGEERRKDRGKEKEVWRAASSCRLIVHGFTLINSDQCYTFGEPTPVLEDPEVLLCLAGGQQPRRCRSLCSPAALLLCFLAAHFVFRSFLAQQSSQKGRWV